MGQNNRRVLLWISFFADLCINLATLYLVFMSLNKYIGAPIGKRAMANAIILVLVTSLIYFMFNIYSFKRFERLRMALLRTIIAQLSSFVLVIMLVVLFSPGKKSFLIFSSVCYGISLVAILLKRTITTKLIHSVRTRDKFQRKIIIIGNGLGAVAFAEQIDDNAHFGYNIIGCITDAESTNFTKLGGYSDLDEILKKENPYEVVISLDKGEKIGLQKIISACDNHGTRALIVPFTYKYFKSKCQIDMIGDLPIINTRAIPLDNIANSAVKRIMDIIISLVMIILTSPIMLLAMVGVKLSSKGPVIFKQERVGRNNEIFTMYKFRSMKVNDMSDTAWTTDDDPRKTRFGTFMRKTGIDELPQLFNVLFGSMSIIGPRPELPKYVEEYSKIIPLYMIKHQVKPGITGLAQIYGFRGDTSIEKRIEMDIKYIENWSLFNDVKILVLTPFKMFNRNEKYVK